MPPTVLAAIKDMDFVFENTLVSIVANRNMPEIKLGGFSVGPFEEGNEYQVHYWVAKELERTGSANFREEERLDPARLFKIQWKERAQTAGQISSLSAGFYPRLRRYAEQLRAESVKTPEKMREFETVVHLTQDIVNSRLRKIVSLASAPTPSEQVLKNLTNEEKLLYGKLSHLIQNWRKQILEYEDGQR